MQDMRQFYYNNQVAFFLEKGMVYQIYLPGARVVNVSSVAGLLTMLPDDSPWKEKLAKSGSDLTVSAIFMTLGYSILSMACYKHILYAG